MSPQQELVFEPPIDGGVVVGYDGSAAAGRAVLAAAEDALRRGAVLHIVRAWLLSNALSEAGAPAGTVPSLAEVEEAVRASVDAVVAESQAGHEGLQVVGHVQHRKAAHTLVAASERADLLVVSRRGKGGFVDLLLGSTADQVVRHARCSVLVIRS